MAFSEPQKTLLGIALSENARLLEENARLRKLLADRGLPTPAPRAPEVPPQPIPIATAPDKHEEERRKIALFRSLFRGREDIYAVRWQGRDGKHGYMPAAIQDWEALSHCALEQRKRVSRKTRKLLLLTDEAIRNHLTGRHTIGVYPLLADETCWFLAVDFDKKTWKEDSLEFMTTCRRLAVPAYLERSRSGDGAHVWIFFTENIAASLARKIGCAILTQTMERRPEIGLNSYDRLFPNQDTLPKGGFGNLIALPLQRQPRLQGNSIFVDESFEPVADQWALLSAVERMKAADVEAIVNEALRRGEIIGVRMSVAEDGDEEEPWSLPPSKSRRERPIAGPFPATVEIVLGNQLYVPRHGLPAAMLNRLNRIAAFQNPEFYKAQAMRLPTYDKPRVISCAEDFPEHTGLPRGCLPEVQALLERHGIRVSIEDERFDGRPIDVRFSGTLRDFQPEAFENAIAHDAGVICAPTAFGKTVLAARLIAERGVNTLVIVHRQQLLDQWRDRLAGYLGLPSERIGQLGGGREKPTGFIDVASIQSLQRKGVVKDIVADYGHVIVDECHHLSAFTFEQVMRQVKARYILGLTATPVRKDGHQPIIHMQCGPIVYSLSARKAAEASPYEHKVVPRTTAFETPAEHDEPTIQDLYRAVSTDQGRSELIADDVIAALRGGRSPLVLTGRTEHLERLRLLLSDRVRHLFVLKGGMGRKQRAKVMADMAAVPASEERAILATGSYIGEGFDDPRLDTLFLAMPISWRGTLQQYVGRLHRIHEGKRVVQVYDYVDGNVPMLSRMFEKRLRGYAAIGYTVESTPVDENVAVERTKAQQSSTGLNSRSATASDASI
jgi:superfamily II DNA or RNA helicase